MESRRGLLRALTDPWTLVGFGLGLVAMLTEVMQTPGFDPHLEFWLVLPGWPVFVMLLVGSMSPFFLFPAGLVGVLATGVLYGSLAFVVRQARRLVWRLVKGHV